MSQKFQISNNSLVGLMSYLVYFRHHVTFNIQSISTSLISFAFKEINDKVFQN